MPRVEDAGLSVIVGNVDKLASMGGVAVGINEAEAAKIHGSGENGTLGIIFADEITIGALGLIHEYGLGNPQRSFLGDTLDAKRAEVDASVMESTRAVMSGRVDAASALRAIGAAHLGQVRARILAHIPPPNAQSTIRRKGSDTPLIDTRELYNSLSVKIGDAA